MSKFKNVLLAGAIGDAFGYLVEFDDVKGIKQKYGASGLTFSKFFDGISCSDDTQMTLFLFEAIKNWNNQYSEDAFKELAHKAFYDWYKTQVGFEKAPEDYNELKNKPRNQEERVSFRCLQNKKNKKELIINSDLSRDDFSLLSYSDMWHLCAPGFTCLKALGSGEVGNLRNQVNDSMGCGMVMRVAPVLYLKTKFPHLTDLDLLNAAYIQAAITHGNYEGLVATGVYTMLLKYLIDGFEPVSALRLALMFVYDLKNDTFKIVEKSPLTLKAYFEDLIKLVNEDGILDEIKIEEVCGGGWVATSCVGLAFYAFCKSSSFEHCLELAVNHEGDSDSTGTLAAQMYAAYHNIDISKYKKTNLTDVTLKLIG